MKTIKYILILFCATVGLLAQDKEAEPMEFLWDGSSSYKVFDTNATQFQQKEFLIGTQWGHTPKYYVGMNHNAAAGRFLQHEFDKMYEKPITTIYQPTFNWWFIAFRISPAMHYDPTLSMEALINPDSLIKDTSIAKDPTSSVFGFKERNVTSIQSIGGNRRLKINRNVWGVYNPSGNKILSGISEQPNFRTEFCIPSQNEGLFGHRWFLSVNMRKLRNTFNNINQKLLTIKLLYKTDKSSNIDTIRFDSVAIASPNAVDTLPYNRGLQQRKVKVNRLTNEFVITNSMLPNLKEDKTLTASFLTINPSPENEYAKESNSYLINPEFIPGMPLRDYSSLKDNVDTNQVGYKLNSENYKFKDNKPDIPRIVWMDIEVYYHNSAPIAIDYIKIESENAYYMSRGYVDDIYISDDEDVENCYVHVIGDYNYKYCLDSHNVNNMPYNIWARPYSIKHTMQGWLKNEENSATISGTDTKLRQALRFYIQDTESEKPHFWWQLRYANLITNGLSVTRDLPYKHKLYKYYTKSKNKYLGIKIQENENMVPIPWGTKFNYNDLTPYHLGFKWSNNDVPADIDGDGYWESDTLDINYSLNSNYETTLLYKQLEGKDIKVFDYIKRLDLNNPSDLEEYKEIAKQSDFIQINWENSLRDKFYNHQDMLYSDDAWWMNYFLGGEYYEKQYSNPNIKLTRVHCGRFKTGEETRLLLYGSILKGAKGFFYDRECDALYNSPEEGKAQIIGLCVGDSIKALVKYQNYGYYPDDYTPFNQYKSILSDTVGNDFYFCGQDPAKMETDSIKSKKTNIASTLGVAEDRIYLGMRSTRTEVYKISQLIRRLEQNKRRRLSVYPHDLMDLRLVAWYGKGFTKMYSQHPEYKEGDLMNKYLDRDSIRTAKLYQPYRYSCFQNVNDSLNVSYWENIDSSFFDVTILTPKNKSILNLSSYYIGVQNRRTDPLVWDIPTQKMQFYSTAEFEDKCNERNSDNNYWQNLFWRRLGCRLISLKVNRTKPTTKSYFNFSFRINEILSQDTEFNDTYSSWRSDKYCHKVDYYVSYYHTVYNPEIRIKFLPGEGKLLKVRHINNYLSYNDACPVASDIYLRYDLVLDAGESLVYDIELVNNTKNELKDLPILYKFLSDDVNINLNEFINHSNLHPDCYDENKLKRVSIIDSVSPQGNRQIARIKVDKKAGLPELVYRFDVLTKDGKPCEQVFINTDNNIKEYYGKGYKGKKSHTYQPDFVSSLEVNPNPANDKLIVNFISSEVSTYKLRIYDINGSVVYSQDNSVSNIGANELTLDISPLPVGLYNLSLEINNSIFNKKFSIDR